MITYKEFRYEYDNNWKNFYSTGYIDITRFFKLKDFAPRGCSERIELSDLDSNEELNPYKILWGAFNRDEGFEELGTIIERIVKSTMLVENFDFVFYLPLDDHDNIHYYKLAKIKSLLILSRVDINPSREDSDIIIDSNFSFSELTDEIDRINFFTKI